MEEQQRKVQIGAEEKRKEKMLEIKLNRLELEPQIAEANAEERAYARVLDGENELPQRTKSKVSETLLPANYDVDVTVSRDITLHSDMKQEGLAAQFRSQVYDQAAKKPSVVSDKPAKMFDIIHDQNAKKSVSMYDQPVREPVYTASVLNPNAQEWIQNHPDPVVNQLYTPGVSLAESQLLLQ